MSDRFVNVSNRNLILVDNHRNHFSVYGLGVFPYTLSHRQRDRIRLYLLA